MKCVPRLQKGSFILCTRYSDLRTSATFHNKIITRVDRPQLPHYTTCAHKCVERARIHELETKDQRSCTRHCAPHGVAL